MIIMESPTRYLRRNNRRSNHVFERRQRKQTQNFEQSVLSRMPVRSNDSFLSHQDCSCKICNTFKPKLPLSQPSRQQGGQSQLPLLLQLLVGLKLQNSILKSMLFNQTVIFQRDQFILYKQKGKRLAATPLSYDQLLQWSKQSFAKYWLLRTRSGQTRLISEGEFKAVICRPKQVHYIQNWPFCSGSRRRVQRVRHDAELGPGNSLGGQLLRLLREQSQTAVAQFQIEYLEDMDKHYCTIIDCTRLQCEPIPAREPKRQPRCQSVANHKLTAQLAGQYSKFIKGQDFGLRIKSQDPVSVKVFNQLYPGSQLSLQQFIQRRLRRSRAASRTGSTRPGGKQRTVSTKSCTSRKGY